MIVAIAASLSAGACFALAGVFQQRAASARPEDEAMSFRLLLGLVREPVWRGGIGLAVVAYGFQALALACGPLSLVQPVIVCELLFALPLSARLYGTRLGRREWLGAVAVAGGLAMAISAARPQEGDPAVGLAGWPAVLAGAGAVTLAALTVCRFVRGTVKASVLALAGGVVMGTQSVLLKATISLSDEGWAAVFSAWQTYLLVVASIGGLLLIQSAFQAGPLAASLPVIDATEPAVAIAIGMALFGETVRGGWPAGGLTALGMVLVLAGIVALDTSPALTGPHATTATPGARQGGGRRSGPASRTGDGGGR